MSFYEDGAGLVDDSEPCVLCGGAEVLGGRPCPACCPESTHIGLEGEILCHYIDQEGVAQHFTIASTQPMQHMLRRQELIRSTLEDLCRQHSCVPVSIQFVILGAERIVRTTPARPTAQVLSFPVRLASPME